MPDISALGIKVTSTGVVKTTNELTAFSKAASAARTAARNPINIRTGSNASIAKALADIQKLDKALQSIGSSSGIQSLVNAQKQVADSINKTTDAAQKQVTSVDRVITQSKRAATEVDGLAGATRNVGTVMTEVSSRANEMAAASLRIAEAEKLAAEAGMQLSVAQMAAIGSGQQNAEQLIKQATATQSLAVESEKGVKASIGLARANSEASAKTDEYTKSAEASLRVVRDMAGEHSRLEDAIKDLARAEAIAKNEIDAAKAAHKAGQISLETYRKEVLLANAALVGYKKEHSDAIKEVKKAIDVQNGVAGSTRSANFATRSLSMSLFSLGERLATGRISMRDLIVEVPRLADSFNVLAKETGGAGNAIAKLGARFLPLAAVAGTAAAAFGGLLFYINNEKRTEIESYAASLGLTAEQIEKAGGAAITATDLIGALWDKIKEALEIEKILGDVETWFIDTFKAVAANVKKNVSEIYAIIYTIDDALKYIGNNSWPVFAEAGVSALNAAGKAIVDWINKAIRDLDRLMTFLNPILALSGALGLRSGPIQLDYKPIESAYSGAGKAAGEYFAKGLNKAYGDHLKTATDWMAGQYADLTDRSVKRAQGRMDKAAEAAGKKAGEKAGKAAGKAAAEEMIPEWAKGLQKDVDTVLDGLGEDFKKWEAEYANMPILDELDRIIISGRTAGRVVGRELEEVAKIQERWNVALDNTLTLLDRIGGAASTFGKVAGVLALANTGDAAQNRANVAMGLSGLGGVGTIAGSLLGGREMTEAMGLQFKKALQDVFGIDNEKLATKLGNTLANFVQGAGVGSAVGSIMGGGKTAQLGSMIGGALGQEFGGKVIGAISSKLLSSLGGAAGPIGAIAGSILGNVLGKALSGNEKGRATFGAGGAFTVTGDNAQREAAAGELAKSVSDALRQIGDAFGATVGSFTGMIGVRNSNIRYDPAGQSLKQGMNFGQDSAAALAAAIQDAISDGVFEGLSAGVERLLKGEGDIERQIQKALSFQGVFTELEQRQDPEAFALKELAKWRDEMGSIFTEASATTEEFAKLEELTALKRKDIIEQFGEDASEVERRHRELSIELMAAQGKAAEALAAARQLELEGLDDVSQAIMKQVYMFRDAAALFQQKSSLDIDILRLQGREVDAIAMARNNELRSMDASLRPLAMRKYALEDEARAAEEARVAAEELARHLEAVARERYGLETQWLQLIGDTNALRVRALDQLDESNRGLQMQIWAEEDRRAAIKATQDTIRDEISARNNQIGAINSTISALSQASKRWSDMAANIREFRAGLFAGDAAGGLSFDQTSREFQRVSRMARLGDEGALQAFTGAAQSYLDAALGNAASLVDYQRAIGLVAGAADAAAEGADGVARQAAQQLGYLYQQVGELEALNEQAEQQIEVLNASLEAQEKGMIPTLKDLLKEQKDAAETQVEIREEEKAENIAIINLLSEQNSWLRRVIEGNGLNVNLPDVVNVTGNVNVANTPLPVDQVP